MAFILGWHKIDFILTTARSPKTSLIFPVTQVWSSSWEVTVRLDLLWSSSRALSNICKAENSSALLMSRSKPSLSCSWTPKRFISRPCLAMFSVKMTRIIIIWYFPFALSSVCESKVNKLRAVFFEKGSLIELFFRSISASREITNRIFSSLSFSESISLYSR